MRFPTPVLAGDTLRVGTSVLAARASRPTCERAALMLRRPPGPSTERLEA